MSTSIIKITPQNVYYPALLQQIPDKPKQLYLQGNINLFQQRCFAVVGTRKPTAYGRSVTRQFTGWLAKQGCVIVSGLASGVDAIAHEVTVNVGGETIAVLAHGLNMIYPKENERLAQRILDTGGMLLTECAIGEELHRGSFPRRNRIIAGLCKGILVTEAAAKSGAKITVSCAAKYGREVFAVPGIITNPYSEGTKEMINNGAMLVTKPLDIFEALHWDTVVFNEHKNTLKFSLSHILYALQDQPKTLDTLVEETHMNIQTLSPLLTELEMLHYIARDLGKYYLQVDGGSKI